MKAMKLIADQILGSTITGYNGKNNSIVQYKTGKDTTGTIEIIRHQDNKDLTGQIIDFVADSGEVYAGNDRVGFIL